MNNRVSLDLQIRDQEQDIRDRERAYQPMIGRGQMRAAEAELRLRYAEAILATLRWLRQHEAEIKRHQAHRAEIEQLLGLAPEVRAAILAHGPTVAELALELARGVAVAAAGGPMR